jgi:hypothetical protein
MVSFRSDYILLSIQVIILYDWAITISEVDAQYSQRYSVIDHRHITLLSDTAFWVIASSTRNTKEILNIHKTTKYEWFIRICLWLYCNLPLFSINQSIFIIGVKMLAYLLDLSIKSCLTWSCLKYCWKWRGHVGWQWNSSL